MRILVVCDQGNNRSVTVASQLKYWGNDVLTAGLANNGAATLDMLSEWADRIILTDRHQVMNPWLDQTKLDVWDIGPDVYPRPFNPQLLAIVKRMMQDHKSEYKNK